MGTLRLAYPAFMGRQMLAWSRSWNLWMRRSSILCQLSFNAETDLDLLYVCIEPSLNSKEFFLKEGDRMGATPGYVERSRRGAAVCVETHRTKLSAMSVREATKKIVCSFRLVQSKNSAGG